MTTSGRLNTARILAPELSVAERFEAGGAKLVSFSVCENWTTPWGFVPGFATASNALAANNANTIAIG
jgi:hypothetical protein